MNIPAHKAGPALAAGNAVVLKPSPKAPLTTERFMGILHEAGLPRDLLQILHGGAEVVEALVEDDVSAVSFTGSSRVGPRIASRAGARKVLLELGGNDPIIVLPDADLEAAARAILEHRFGSSGQRCTSCKRAFLHRDVYEKMRNRLVAGAAGLVVGDPLEEDTDVGPLIDEEAAVEVMRKLDAAVRRGARVLCGGHRRGSTVAPTIVEGARPDDELLREETFGPVLPILGFRDVGEVVERVNDTPFGLQAGVFTNRLDAVQELFEGLQVGALIVNDGPGLRVEPIPFGGVKSSGVGREGIRYAVEELTTLKTLVM